MQLCSVSVTRYRIKLIKVSLVYQVIQFFFKVIDDEHNLVAFTNYKTYVLLYAKT